MYLYSRQRQCIRSIFRIIRSPGACAALVLAAVLLGLVVTDCTRADDSLDRKVGHIFARGGDVQYRLPELMAQLELRAILELGRLEKPRDGGRFEATEDYPYYEPDPPPPDQTVKAFELVEGTVSQALDAYCTLNPQLEWRQANGTIWIRRKSKGATMLKKALAMRLPKYASPKDTRWGEATPLRAHIEHLMQQVNNEFGHRVAGYGWVSLSPWEPGAAQRFATHEPLGSRPPFQRENATVKEVLLATIKPLPNQLVLLTGNDRFCGASLVNWSRMSRQLNLKQLALAFTLQPKPLHGCINVPARMDSALRELRRRHHFEPKRVVQALIDQETIEALVQPMGPQGAIPVTTQTVGALFRMNDAGLTKHAAEVILKLPDPVARYHFVSGSLPRPYQPGFDLALPVWKQLAHDENPSTRTLAHMMLDWHKKRPARLKSLEESE